MIRNLLTPVLAIALSISTFSAVPARADNRDLAKIIAGIAAIAIISNALDNGNVNLTYNPPFNHPAHPRWDLPERCLKTIDTRRDGEVRMFTKRCLRRNYQWFESLPERCEFTVGRHNNRTTGYRPRCLRREGYRFDRSQARR